MQQQIETTLIFTDMSLFPSLNIMLREHWNARKVRKDKLVWLIREQTKNRHAGQVRVRFIRQAHKLMDWDNFIGGAFKSAGDAMVIAKLIIDDKPDYITELSPEQEKIAKGGIEKVIIKITDKFIIHN